MTTVIDPGGTDESAIFNKGGTALLNVTLSAGLTMTIPAIAGKVVVSATYPSTVIDPLPPYPILSMSPDFQIGDEVWIVTPGEGDTIFMQDEFGNNLLQAVGGGFIKVASGTDTTSQNWRIMSYFPDSLALTIP